MHDEGLEGNETVPEGLFGPLSALLLFPPELPPELPPMLQAVNWACSKASWVGKEFGDGLRGLGERILADEYHSLMHGEVLRNPS